MRLLNKLTIISFLLEVMRSEYNEFLRKAREVLVVLQNSSRQNGGGQYVPPSQNIIKEIRYKEPVASSFALPSAQRKDIVLGMAQDIDPKNFAVFCFSLRKYVVCNT